MHEPRIGPESNLIARPELVTLAEHRDDFLTPHFCDDVKLRAGRFDDLHLGLGAIARQGEMLRPDAADDRAAVAVGGHMVERKPDTVAAIENGALAGAQTALEDIHCRRSDEAGDKEIGRLVVELERRADL